MIRIEVQQLASLGRLPSEDESEDRIRQHERLISQVQPPVSDDEARVLIQLFGMDDCFGLAWSLVHLIETAPGWPLEDCLREERNEWIQRLARAARRVRGGG
jgi:hypothetical protein